MSPHMLVTGGARGIGRATAVALAAAGAAVAVIARNESQLAETASEIESAGGRGLVLPADVADRAAVDRVVGEAERRLGPVDLLVNNAGRGQPFGLTWEIDPDDWWRTVEVNLRGTLLCARAVLPGMVARGRGRIVNVASGLGLAPGRHVSAYASSKAAIIRLTEAIAAECADRGVQAFAINPGLVMTAMLDEIVDSPRVSQLLPGLVGLVREGKELPPERPAALIVALASGAADGLSGRYINVHDDLPALVARAEEIRRDRLHTMRQVT